MQYFLAAFAHYGKASGEITEKSVFMSVISILTAWKMTQKEIFRKFEWLTFNRKPVSYAICNWIFTILCKTFHE